MAAASSAAGQPVGDEPVELGLDHLERLLDAFGRGARVDRRGSRCRRTRRGTSTRSTRGPRCSRISWKSRDDMPPPSAGSRRSSASRSGSSVGTERRPSTRCACSVGRCTTASARRRRGLGVLARRARGHRRRAARLRSARRRRRGEVAGRGRDHDVGGLVVRVVVLGDAVARHRRDRRFGCRALRDRAGGRGSARA